MSRVLEAKNGRQRVAAVARPAEVAVRRPILVGILLTIVLLALSAIESRPSGAATTGKATKSPATTPAVSPVTVTVPGQTAPAPTVIAPPITTPTPTPAAPPATVGPAVTPPVTSTPSRSAPAAQAAPADRATTAATGGGSPAAYARRAPHDGGSARRLRSVVVRLSSCVSRLTPRGQRLLLMRAGIGTAGSNSRRAVARKLRISVAREARSERAALRKLRSAARRGSCGRIPAWIHVPAANQLVLVDPALTVSAPAVSDQTTRVSLTLNAAAAGSRLISGSEWRRLVLMPAQS